MLQLNIKHEIKQNEIKAFEICISVYPVDRDMLGPWVNRHDS